MPGPWRSEVSTRRAVSGTTARHRTPSNAAPNYNSGPARRSSQADPLDVLSRDRLPELHRRHLPRIHGLRPVHGNLDVQPLYGGLRGHSPLGEPAADEGQHPGHPARPPRQPAGLGSAERPRQAGHLGRGQGGARHGRGRQLPNRLTPLFSLYSAVAQDNFYTTVAADGRLRDSRLAVGVQHLRPRGAGLCFVPWCSALSGRSVARPPTRPPRSISSRATRLHTRALCRWCPCTA